MSNSHHKDIRLMCFPYLASFWRTSIEIRSAIHVSWPVVPDDYPIARNWETVISRLKQVPQSNLFIAMLRISPTFEAGEGRKLLEDEWVGMWESRLVISLYVILCQLLFVPEYNGRRIIDIACSEAFILLEWCKCLHGNQRSSQQRKSIPLKDRPTDSLCVTSVVALRACNVTLPAPKRFTSLGMGKTEKEALANLYCRFLE